MESLTAASTPMGDGTALAPDAGSDDATRHRLRAPWSTERLALRAMLHALGDPPLEFVLWTGERIGVDGASNGATLDASDGAAAGGPPPVARIRIHDPATLHRMALNPEVAFGDAFMAGAVDVDGDLVTALESVYRVRARRPRWVRWRDRVFTPAARIRPGTVGGARSNIRKHYDLGNEFFSWWLDEDMVYTCAYFTEASMRLEAAQVEKMDHVCRKLRLKPGDHVVEAGCGWGSLGRHMARHYGVRVTAYNISAEQIGEARNIARALRLDDRVTYVEDDYRNIRGDYDAFVSIGMLEHVGPDNYEAFGRVIDRSLKPDGLGLIHSIGQARPEPLNGWIEQRIFPGAQPPTLSEMMPLFERAELTVLDVENLRLHYAQTLEHWLQRYDRVRPRVESRYGAPFARAWRLYLAGSLAAFRTGELQLYQVLFSHLGSNAVPRTRRHQYAGQATAPEDGWTTAMR